MAPFKAFDYDGNLKSAGFYKNGLKDSTWMEYYPSGQKRLEEFYKKDEPTGIWNNYNHQGETELTYDFTDHKLLYLKSPQPGEARVINGSDTIMTKVEQVPVYIGGKYKIMSILSHNMKYPESAMEQGVQGKVYVKFIIDEQGKTYGHTIQKGFWPDCDTEALRAVKLIPDHWVPAVKDGKNVATEMIIPINFTSM